jgi:hypothetical protein
LASLLSSLKKDCVDAQKDCVICRLGKFLLILKILVIQNGQRVTSSGGHCHQSFVASLIVQSMGELAGHMAGEANGGQQAEDNELSQARTRALSCTAFISYLRNPVITDK